jgi:hypothetical protein
VLVPGLRSLLRRAVLGFLAAIGLGTAIGVALFGTIALVAGIAAATVVLLRRRRSQPSCEGGNDQPVDMIRRT